MLGILAPIWDVCVNAFTSKPGLSGETLADTDRAISCVGESSDSITVTGGVVNPRVPKKSKPGEEQASLVDGISKMSNAIAAVATSIAGRSAHITAEPSTFQEVKTLIEMQRVYIEQQMTQQREMHHAMVAALSALGRKEPS